MHKKERCDWCGRVIENNITLHKSGTYHWECARLIAKRDKPVARLPGLNDYVKEQGSSIVPVSVIKTSFNQPISRLVKKGDYDKK